jgi:replicative DNA helicase
MKNKAKGSLADSRVAQLTDILAHKERVILGTHLEQPELWDGTLTPDQFTLAYHRKILTVIRDLNNAGHPADFESVCVELGESVDVAYLTQLRTGVMPEYYAKNIRAWESARRDRDYYKLIECMADYDSPEERRDGLERLKIVMNRNGQMPD